MPRCQRFTKTNNRCRRTVADGYDCGRHTADEPSVTTKDNGTHAAELVAAADPFASPAQELAKVLADDPRFIEVIDIVTEHANDARSRRHGFARTTEELDAAFDRFQDLGGALCDDNSAGVFFWNGELLSAAHAYIDANSGSR